jgi:hypothetical protein
LHPQLVEAGGEAAEDADRLRDVGKRIKKFADQVVAHFDRKHARRQKRSLPEFEEVVEEFTQVWVRWYPRITGHAIVGEAVRATWKGRAEELRKTLLQGGHLGLDRWETWA